MSPTITDMRHARLASNLASLGGRTIIPPDSITNPNNSMKSESHSLTSNSPVTVNVYCLEAGREVRAIREPSSRDSSIDTENPLDRNTSEL